MFGFLKPRKSLQTFSYTCATCGQNHTGSPSFSAPHPPGYADSAKDETATRLLDTDDWCVTDYGDGIVDRFIRVVLEVPIDGTDDVFTWGVWVTQSEESFERYRATFGTDQSDDRSFGWLFVDFAPYAKPGQDLVHLACNVQWQSNGKRPKIDLHDTDHSLVLDQQNGLSQSAAIEMATKLLHG